jgi:RNA-binding protein 23/39
VAGSESVFTKDQRTVFVSQLVMRTTEKDIRRYFKKKVGCKVNEVILLRDRRTRNHKGCAYVEFARVEDVATAVGVSGQPPDFQRFPILVKASEAEKNYAIPASSSVVTASMMGTTINYTPFVDKDGKQVEAQKVYVGGLDPTVTEEHLFAIFSQFGQLDKVSMQMDPATNLSRGYAFLSFRDPKDANLSIQSMAGQVLAGRPMKTGWANQASSIPGVPIVTSDEYPEDGSARVQKAFQVLGQLIGGSSEAAINAMALSATAEKAIEAAMGMAEPPKLQNVGADESALQVPAHSASSIPTVAEARASMRASIEAQKSAVAVAAVTAALTPAKTPKLIGGADNPTRHILVYNMFDKDEETEPGWEKDIEEEFLEEAAKFGKIEKVVVMHKEPGGKIYASFEGIDGAEACAKNLAGRWFDKRQLRVDFIDEKDLFKESAPSLS